MLNRRGLVGAGAALTAGAVVADSLKGWLGGDAVAYAASVPGPRPVVTGQGGGRPVVDVYDAGPVGLDEVEALERSVQVFRAWDAARGGGLQRKAVVGQLNEVGGLLTSRHNPAVEQRLWLVAANLAVLAGWMSHDVGLEPTAQKYFVIAAEAAKEAGDRPRAGEAISRAARQMVHLGRADDALDLMSAAKAAAAGRCRERARCSTPWRPGRTPRSGTPRTPGGCWARPRTSSPRTSPSRRRPGCRSSTRPSCAACRRWCCAPSRSTTRRRPRRPGSRPSG